VTAAPPIQFVKGVGPRFAEKLAARGIRTPQDALFLFPKGYEDRRRIVPMGELSPGKTVPVKGKVLSVRGGDRRLWGSDRLFEAVVGDGTGQIAAKWFRVPAAMRDRFRPGDTVVLCGTVRAFQFRLEMHHPEILGKDEDADPVNMGRIVPVYPDVEGVPPRALRRIQWEVVRTHASTVKEFFPEWMLDAAGVRPIDESIAAVHFPPPEVEPGDLLAASTPARRRLVFQELFFIQWMLAKRRTGMAREAAAPLRWDGAVEDIRKRLPFLLTGAQRRVVKEVLRDLAQPHPMHRLLQGDVGSGKTIVAWIAATVAWKNGAQSAVMAPTEILAEQHFRRFEALCEGLPARVVILTSKVKGKARAAVLSDIREGRAHVIVGTHALIQEGVDYKSLALAVIDEQHRFGVLQRAALREKAATAPHLLVLTATPIPRTLAMTLYGDLDVSIIDEMPPGRTSVETQVVPPDKEARGRAWARIRKELAAGGRVYIVLPLVEESEKLALRDAVRTAELVRGHFPGVEVGLLHGRMKGEEKNVIMGRFQSGEIRILVSTTVVEVGVDVPEATVMVVVHAERFGLSQLHQLRGRVGRGSRPSICFLFVDAPTGDDAARRLSVMERTTDGFVIAEEDLRIRGPGDFTGVRQSGIPDLVFADLVRDTPMLIRSREIAETLLGKDPDLALPEHAELKRWLEGKAASSGPLA
jgi:ATP-dependent DNA helicase RecG